MANLHLVTGYAGAEHITAADHGSFHEHLLRGGDFVMTAGDNFAAAIITNNQVRISDGELMMQGRHVKMEPGTYVSLAIDNGAQSVRRNDLIVARYTRDTDSGVEECNLVVVKGTAAASNPADPEITTGNLNTNKDRLHDFPLYRVRLNGLTIEAVEAMFTPQLPLYDLAGGGGAYNLLDNSNFANPVNQRGQEVYTAQGETLNRWDANSNSVTVTVNDGYVALSTPGQGHSITQSIDKAAANVNGKTLTVACEDTDGNIYCKSGTANPGESIYVPVGAGNLMLVADAIGNLTFYINPNGTLHLRWVAVYFGEYSAQTLPEYAPKGYGVEVVNCNGGALSEELLWENASEGSSFASQTVNLDLAAFSSVKVVYKASTSGSTRMKEEVEVGEKIQLIGYANAGASSSTELYTREFATTTTGVTLGKASKKGLSSNTVENDNAKMIPVRIYGIKGAKR